MRSLLRSLSRSSSSQSLALALLLCRHRRQPPPLHLQITFYCFVNYLAVLSYAPRRVVGRGVAPRCIVLIGGMPGRTIVRSAAQPYPCQDMSLYAPPRPAVYLPVPVAQQYQCKQRGAPPFPRQCQARPYHCKWHGTMVCGPTPLRIPIEVSGDGVGGSGLGSVVPSRTVVVAPGAKTSQTIVCGAAPSRVLAGNGCPAVSSLE